MSPEALRTEVKLQIGQMPMPRFLNIPSPFENGARPIGIETFSSLEGHPIRPFIWLQNIGGDLTREGDRDRIARLLTEMTIEQDTDFAIGPAISLKKSDPRSGQVKVIFDSGNRIGIYADFQKRALLPWRMTISRLNSEQELMFWSQRNATRSSGFEEILQRVKSVLPRPVGNSPKR
ncbi:MAG: hypothetical protein HYW62_01040 [Candidatus Levybacteria bacterium]|nr:hypothetical protein [Candidatus Levybacteria bacterium]